MLTALKVAMILGSVLCLVALALPMLQGQLAGIPAGALLIELGPTRLSIAGIVLVAVGYFGRIALRSIG